MSKSKTKEEETEDILSKLLEGEDITEKVEVKGHSFTLKYPVPRVLRQIQILMAQRFPDIDLNNLTRRVYLNYEAYATLDVVVVDGPKWMKNLESWEDYPDEDLVADLYRRYLQFYERVQAEIGGGSTESEGSSGTSEEEDMGGASFSGITYGPENEGTDG